MTPLARTRLVKSLARDVGFDLVGVAPANPLPRAEYYRRWLAAGHAAGMSYLHRNVQFRASPALLLPGTRAIICVALNYKRADGYVRRPHAAIQADRCEPTGLVAQYARGRDYHAVMRRMLAELVRRLRPLLDEPFETRICVDTAPILERELAAAAGLGWIGKNTCLVNRQLGSYLLLAEVLTTVDLAADEPVPPGCGRCARCLEACPTSAFLRPWELSAARCLSYWTVEHRGDIPVEFHGPIGDRVFGCDQCQQVCPYNARAPDASNPEIALDIVPAHPNLLWLLKIDPAGHRRFTAGSAARRASAEMWRRNAAIVAGNAPAMNGTTRAAVVAATRDRAATVRRAAEATVLRLAQGVPRSECAGDSRTDSDGVR